ncbi:carboxypeptidase regulatory-like domain-containing protein [Acidobacteria bacterium AH-259-D05]|nr:carboxypeptidase regulatory-like domain-containing protein [Acidobacteria bacterium AH-259-D05]
MRTLVTMGLMLSLVSVSPAAAAADATGMVTGIVNHPSVKRFPTVIYIEEIPGGKFSPPGVNPIMDQRGKVFLPHVLPVLVGTTVEFLNSDSFDHNVFSPDGEEYDLGKWSKGGKRSYSFNQPGVYTQLCRVHPEMVAYAVVVKTPHFAVADEEGKFRIPEVPPGTWILKIWNERLRPKQLEKSFTVDVTEGQETEIDISF